MNPTKVASRVEMVENHITEIQVGKMVAVLLEDWTKTPVIGKVANVDDDETFTIAYWKGSYNSEWTPHLRYSKKTKTHDPWTQNLPKQCVALVGFELLNGRLQTTTKQFLRSLYKELKQ